MATQIDSKKRRKNKPFRFKFFFTTRGKNDLISFSIMIFSETREKNLLKAYNLLLRAFTFSKYFPIITRWLRAKQSAKSLCIMPNTISFFERTSLELTTHENQSIKSFQNEVACACYPLRIPIFFVPCGT